MDTETQIQMYRKLIREQRDLMEQSDLSDIRMRDQIIEFLYCQVDRCKVQLVS